MPFATFLKKLKIDKPEDASPSREHGTLLAAVKKLVKISRDDMAKNFTKWDLNDAIFRSERKIDKEDRAAHAKGDPAKLIVPLTFAQIMTFTAFSIQSLTQNRRFFELEPTRRDEAVLEEPLELIMEHDLRRNKWTSFLVQFFLDIGRFSLGAAEVCYTEESRWMRVPKTETVEGAFGTQSQNSSYNFEQLTTFVGNRVYPVSPYRFLPDTRLPLTRYQEGEFCGSEELWSMSRLRGDGNLFNLDKIPKLTHMDYRERRKVSRVDLGPLGRENPNLGSGMPGDGTSFPTDPSGYVKSGTVIVTKMVMDITPKDFKLDDGSTPLGDEEFPVRYILWYANDKTIIRFEEAYYLHCQFPYICAQYTPDQHQTINEGLSDVCEQLTDLITWKINAHIASQRNSVTSKYIIDPAGVDVKSLESRDPYIRLKKNAAQTDVRRYIMQFVTQDTTQNVISQDVPAMKSLVEQITGWSAQMQGQYSEGRRSATQDRVVAQGAGARGKTVLGGIWDNAFEPLGEQLLINNRQEMSFEEFQSVVGGRDWPVNPVTQVNYTIEEVYQLFKSTPEELARAEHFFVFDGTLPSEKAFLAQSMQEIFIEILQNPQVAQLIGFGPEQIRELFDEIYTLRGVTPARLPAPQAAQPQPAPGAPSIAALPAPAAQPLIQPQPRPPAIANG